MKKAVMVIVAVIGLIGGTYLADRATRVRHRLPAQEMNSSIGKPAPDLTLKDLDGRDVSLAQYKGKVVLVNFWATWCDPCRGEIPELIELQQKYSARGFTVLGLAMDDEGRSVVAPFVQKERFDVKGSQVLMNYPILIGDDAAAAKFGGLFGYPTTIVISRDAKQVTRIAGAISYERISKIIESQL
jgi:cytochrome c biogenesis protein CcmG/thiol:disulfide interchange protein DsbE